MKHPRLLSSLCVLFACAALALAQGQSVTKQVEISKERYANFKLLGLTKKLAENSVTLSYAGGKMTATGEAEDVDAALAMARVFSSKYTDTVVYGDVQLINLGSRKDMKAVLAALDAFSKEARWGPRRHVELADDPLEIRCYLRGTPEEVRTTTGALKACYAYRLAYPKE